MENDMRALLRSVIDSFFRDVPCPAVGLGLAVFDPDGNLVGARLVSSDPEKLGLKLACSKQFPSFLSSSGSRKGEGNQNVQLGCYRIKVGEKEAGYVVTELKEEVSRDALEQITLFLGRALEIAIHERYAVQSELLWHTREKEVLENITDGFMTLNSQGIITYLNGPGGELLGLDPDAVIGRPLKDIVSFDPDVLSVLATGVGWVDREFILEMPKKRVHLVKSAFPILAENGTVAGVIDTFRPMQKVSQTIKKIAGLQAHFTFEDIIYRSKAMAELVETARTAACGLSNVLVLGESGTGKELLAQAIHLASERANGPFVVLDCASIPRELAESELFGYVEGSFTGAKKGGKPGKFELAHGGTIFLDEIGDMPLDLQAKLLRVLQTREIMRVGDVRPIWIDVRVIAATNRDLISEIRNDNFRADLFYRLNVVTLTIPPLRQRPEDIEALVMHFLEKMGHRFGSGRIRISASAISALEAYSWPGNIRELENVVERALTLAVRDGRIDLKHLPDAVRSAACSNRVRPDTLLATHESRAIQEALALSGGNRAGAARLLGISRSTLYEKMRRYKIS